MASLIEELITTLESEEKIYKDLIPLNEKKTRIIIKNDLEALQKITDKEQETIDKINALERKRQEVILNIGTVLSRDPGTLDIRTMIRLLDKQPQEQGRLSEIHTKLLRTVKRLQDLNAQNESLIRQSLEIIEFNMNIIRSTRTLPGNNYGKDAAGVDVTTDQTRMFDTKQ